MANPTPIYPGTLRTFDLQIANTGSGPHTQNTTVLYAVTPTANGARIDSIIAVNSDNGATSANNYNVAIYVTKTGGANVLMGVVNVSSGAGNSSAVPPHDITADPNLAITYSDPYGNKVFYVEANATISVQPLQPIMGGQTLSFVGMAGEY